MTPRGMHQPVTGGIAGGSGHHPGPVGLLPGGFGPDAAGVERCRSCGGSRGVRWLSPTLQASATKMATIDGRQ